MIPRFGTGSTKAWYGSYHDVVFSVPRCGIGDKGIDFFSWMYRP